MIPDVQKKSPEIGLRLTKVGASNIKKILKIPRENKRPIILLANFEVFVDLPSSQKGSHMSRNPEIINEILEDIVKKPVYVLEDLCEDIARKVLNNHEYATRSEVEMKSKLMIRRRMPLTRLKTQEFVKLIAKANAYRGEETKVKKEVGAEVKGVILRPYLSDSAKHRKKGMPTSGCTQRATASLTIEVPENHAVRIEDIVKILENSMSTKAYGYLTKEDELMVVSEACARPNFVEDVVEYILQTTAKKFNSLPDDTKIMAKCIAEGTLFTYNSFAERVTTLGRIKIPPPRSIEPR